MNRERYENTELELVYKNVLTCTTCGEKYGHDSTPKHKLCPFCERKLFRPRGTKKRICDP